MSNNRIGTYRFVLLVISLIFCGLADDSYAQSLGLNNATPDASSILDMSAIDRGVLVPRMTTAQRTGIGSPANGLLVYDTDLQSFYFYDGTATAWRAILGSSAATELAGWSTLGNAGTNAGTNFLGTTDGVDLVLRTNNVERARLYSSNGLGISALGFATSTGLSIGDLSGTTNTGISVGTANGTTAKGLTIGALSGTTSTGFELGNLTGTTNTGLLIGTLGGTTAEGVSIGALSGTNSKGIEVGAMSGATSNIGLDIGAISAGTATGINVGAISGTGVGNAFVSGDISSTGATSNHLLLGNLSGGNATSHSFLTAGNLSGATANAYGINLGTITGGTTANTGFNLGAITSTGATNSYGINLGAISGSGTNTYGINIGTNSSTGTLATGINVGPISGAATTNAGITINQVSNGTTNNYGLNITGTTEDAAVNFAIHSDAAAPSYLEGDLVIGTSVAPADVKSPVGANKLDVRGTISAALPVVAFAHFNDDIDSFEDNFMGILVASVPSTNTIYVRTTNNGNVNDNALDATANWTGWTDFGQPSGAAGYPYIIDIDVSINSGKDADEQHAVIIVRFSDGNVYMRTITDRRTTAADLDDTGSWDAWALFGSPGM